MGIKIVQDLWLNDVSAELAVDASSLEELLNKYRDNSHGWIVIVKQDSQERGFKVKSLFPREEFDIRGSELVPWLRNEIRARYQRDGAVDPLRQSRLPSQADPGPAFNERFSDVRILVPQHRSKKSNRRNIVESGMSNPTYNPIALLTPISIVSIPRGGRGCIKRPSCRHRYS